ncbi:MAG: PVC-type heme-binding CxxCH protein [Akkermansiaceae bacterium]
MTNKSLFKFHPAILISLLASSLMAIAVTDGKPEKIEGTANPEAIPTADPEKALLSTIKYPKGMTARLFAREPDVQDPTALTFDDQNRLYLAETHRFERGVVDNRRNGHWVQDDYELTHPDERLEMYKKYSDKKPLEYFTKYSEKIRVLEDRDGDGKCDFSKIYADGFNHPLDGTAAGVMALDGKIYFACIPHIWMLEDTDGDLVSDKRTSLQYGYGISVSLSGHDLNGFALGPDNRIYFTIGDRGYNLKTKEGKHLYSQYEGAAFRMERDGSNLEVIHTGLRNPKEVAFDQYGNLFSVDNNADMGDAARIVDIVEGAHSGWHRGHQAYQKFTNIVRGTSRHQANWMEEKQWEVVSEHRAKAILPPSALLTKGPSGLAYNPGTGLNKKWDNHYFICDFTGANSSVIGFEMKPEGAGYVLENSEPFVSGLLCTDIEFGYDGKTYVTDYVGSWPTHGFGNIFTFEDEAELAKPETQGIRKLFANGFNKKTSKELAQLMRHADMRVRLRAQHTLAADTNNRAHFITLAAASEKLTTRLHAVWGLGNLARLKKDTASADQLITLCKDKDAHVRREAIKALGNADYKKAANTAAALLGDANARTRMIAAIALGKLGDSSHIAALIKVLEENADKDAYLRHGAIQGLTLISDPEALLKHKDHSSAAVRLGITITLRKLYHPGIAHFLNDKELSIATEAVQAINDRYIEGARADLAKATHLLGKSTWMIDLRILNSMIRTGGEENINRLIAVASNLDYSDNIRTEALWLLGRFENPPTADPTTSKIRPVSPDTDRKFTPAIKKKLQTTLLQLLKTTSGDPVAEALKLANNFKLNIPQSTLLTQLKETKNSTSVRLAALKKIEADPPADFTALVNSLISDPNQQMHEPALKLLKKLDPNIAFAALQKLLKSDVTSSQQTAIDALASFKHPKANDFLLNLLKKIDDQPVALQLNILESSKKRNTPELTSTLKTYEENIAKKGKLAPFEVALDGGHVMSGRRIFFRHGAANCVQCHKAGWRGGDAGPNLNGLASRQDKRYILESIIDPSAKLAPGYSPISITLKNGKVVSGILMEDTKKQLILKDMESEKTTTYPRAEIATIPKVFSSMPPMGAVLTKAQIRDLMAYLGSLEK